MPTSSSAGVRVPLNRRGEDVVLEEIFVVGYLADSNREMEVPSGVRVTFKHEMSLPPFYWEVGLGEGRHSFAINQFWNKYKVRLESSGPASVVWIL